MKKGTQIKDQYGNRHEVYEIRGTTVVTLKGEYIHTTKCWPVR